jgi:ammonia channel protein AmtB
VQVVDFAGGIVVHISAGFAALASVFVVGPRQYTSEVHRELSRVSLPAPARTNTALQPQLPPNTALQPQQPFWAALR